MDSFANLPNPLAFLEHVFPIIRAGEFMTISGATVLFYDYFLTLPDEIELIWKARPSTISAIFLANRYIMPLLMIVDIYDRLGLATNPSVLVSFCRIWIWVEAYVTLFSFMSMHALVAMRVHALHGGPKRLKLILWACGVVYALTTMALLGAGLYVRQHDLAPAPVFNSCYEEIASFLWTIWLPSLLFEFILFVLTMSKAIQEARRSIYSPISSILYRDGILYFLAISACTMFCMFVWLVAPPTYAGLAKYWATAMVNVAGSRLVLSLKSHAREMQLARNGSLSFGQSSSFVVGRDTHHLDLEEYIKLQELRKDAEYGYSSSSGTGTGTGTGSGFGSVLGFAPSDTRIRTELSQIGTLYPEKYQPYWEAI